VRRPATTSVTPAVVRVRDAAGAFSGITWTEWETTPTACGIRRKKEIYEGGEEGRQR
jgi:hypothetical protein